jgi:hypothetical protein
MYIHAYVLHVSTAYNLPSTRTGVAFRLLSCLEVLGLESKETALLIVNRA